MNLERDGAERIPNALSEGELLALDQLTRQMPGFGTWSRKSGIDHVESPFEYTERRITLRAHLDACDSENGPLLIIPGSHRIGRVPVKEIEGIVSKGEVVACLTNAGDIWVSASAILHASNATSRPTHRRVTAR